MCDVRRIGGGRGLRGGPGKRVDGVFPGRPQRFRHQRQPVDDCSPGRGGVAQDSETRNGTFHGETDRRRESQDWTTARSSMPERDGRDRGNERIAQSKRARTGSLAIVDQSQVAQTCILRADVLLPFSGVTVVSFLFSFRLPRRPHAVIKTNNRLCPLFFCFSFLLGRVSPFPSTYVQYDV